MTRKSYRVFSIKEMANHATGKERKALLEMIAGGWCRNAYVENVNGTSVFGTLLIANGATDSERIVIEE